MIYARENMLEFASKNLLDIFNKLGQREQGALLGNIVEIAVVKNRKAQATDKDGYDMIEDGLEKEIKSCWRLNGKHVRWANITSKFNKCDAFIFIDGVNNKEYEVPHDVVFFEMSITKDGQLRTTEHNLDILEQYEIITGEK
tara:strand:- start:367 stop:792 length:426 start_codon:yes stop_codon:yes gene_type:complete